MHNTVQELRGNIRIFVRVRPFLPSDKVGDENTAISCNPNGTSLCILPPTPRGQVKDALVTTSNGQPAKPIAPVQFTFDNVFPPTAGQADVFNEVSNLVQSALDGFQVCLFSYGQTGSGKTYTMQGTRSSDIHTSNVDLSPGAGLIPRSVRQILDTTHKLESQGWQYNLEASFLEIYNETLRDLLRKGTSVNEEPVALTLHQDAEGNPDVPGLTKVPVHDAAEIDSLLLMAEKRRTVACTAMNERSSRAHLVFFLHLRGIHVAKGISVSGCLHLVDLAGSERVNRSGVEGQRMKEAVAINKSLSCLADVFSALSKKASHIPFRNSKLTHLLQRCFRGDGKTLMLVNLSPTLESASESLCSLRFAQTVSQVELGKPIKRMIENISSTSNTTTTSMNNNTKGNEKNTFVSTSQDIIHSQEEDMNMYENDSLVDTNNQNDTFNEIPDDEIEKNQDEEIDEEENNENDTNNQSMDSHTSTSNISGIKRTTTSASLPTATTLQVNNTKRPSVTQISGMSKLSTNTTSSSSSSSTVPKISKPGVNGPIVRPSIANGSVKITATSRR